MHFLIFLDSFLGVSEREREKGGGGGGGGGRVIALYLACCYVHVDN